MISTEFELVPKKRSLPFFHVFWWHWLIWALTGSYNDIWCNGTHHDCIVAVQVEMHGVTWPWNVMHMSWILNKDKCETKGSRDGHSDGLGNTELQSHWAMTGNQQHFWSVICGVGKDRDAWSEESWFSETEPTAKTPQNLQLFPESQRAMQLWDCISYKWLDGVQLALQRTSESSALEGLVSLSCFLCCL